MKKICIIIYLLFMCGFVRSQIPGEWVWIHGENYGGSAGNQGLQGIPSPLNEPPALYEPCEWTDNSGNFWFYSSGVPPGTTDLYKYDPVANEWTWMGGGAANYGTQGIPSVSNHPPDKTAGVATWVDLNGNFWMFGGYDGYNDLWRYDPLSGIWTWMKGANFTGQAGIYGVKGIGNVANTPGARWECVATWTDNAGDLWLFGGFNLGGVYNDLWKFNIASNQWTWMKGSNVINAPAIYGIQGIEDSSNTPGSRAAYSRWKDNCGNLWLWGGADFTTTSAFNDLWHYNITTNNWTWINGSNTVNSPGRYGSKCVANTTNAPRARHESRSCWTDQKGNFWFFGGGNFSAGFYLNDLWMYCVKTNQWIWQSGDSILNPAGNWGTLGVASPANKPNGRLGPTGWTDHNGHLYMFGGSFAPSYNDLWKYTIDTSCSHCSPLSCNQSLPAADFVSSDTILCANDCITFTDLSVNAISWKWTFAGGTPSSSPAQNPYVCYQLAGTYDVKLIASNPGGSDSLTTNNYITVNPAPPTPNIQDNKGIAKDTLVCTGNPSYISYQWYKDNTLIPGATDSILITYQNGNYNVEVTGSNGCKIAAGINVILSLQNYMSDHTISLWPNPAQDKLIIRQLTDGQVIFRSIDIYNVLGQVCRQSQILNLKSKIEIDVSDIPSGIYFVQLTGDKERWVGRFVKE